MAFTASTSKKLITADQMIPKLSAACYAVRSMFHISNINTLKSIYFAYFHSIIKYGIILGGNASNSRKIFYFTNENHQNYG
jgi:NADH:ubiquinone oxidoreductase subunit H